MKTVNASASQRQASSTIASDVTGNERAVTSFVNVANTQTNTLNLQNNTLVINVTNQQQRGAKDGRGGRALRRKSTGPPIGFKLPPPPAFPCDPVTANVPRDMNVVTSLVSEYPLQTSFSIGSSRGINDILDSETSPLEETQENNQLAVQFSAAENKSEILTSRQSPTFDQHSLLHEDQRPPSPRLLGSPLNLYVLTLPASSGFTLPPTSPQINTSGQTPHLSRTRSCSLPGSTPNPGFRARSFLLPGSAPYPGVPPIPETYGLDNAALRKCYFNCIRNIYRQI